MQSFWKSASDFIAHRIPELVEKQFTKVTMRNQKKKDQHIPMTCADMIIESQRTNEKCGEMIEHALYGPLRDLSKSAARSARH